MLAGETERGLARSCFWCQVSLTYCKVGGVLWYCNDSFHIRGVQVFRMRFETFRETNITMRTLSTGIDAWAVGRLVSGWGASALPETPLNCLTLSFAHFLTIVRTSSSSRTCDRPTLCGWCFTLLPYTMASLNSSTMVLWMALQKSSTVHAVFLSTTGAV